MAEKVLPKLLFSREETQRKIEAQIEKGVKLQDQSINSEDELDKACLESENWSKYNEVLLSKLFNNMVVADEYISFTDPPREFLHPLGGDIYPLSEVLGNYKRSMADSINSLQGIYNRLELYDELVPTLLQSLGKEVFIVHGRDDGTKETVARFVEKFGLKVTILHEQPNKGRTIIEKLEYYASRAGFAIVLLTPDDVGTLRDRTSGQGEPRARQNVVFELGYFMGKLGREQVCPLFKGKIEKPSDIDGIIYVPMDNEDWKLKLGQEMKNAGFPVDMNKIF